jgi:hypothetical protein
MPKGRSSSGSSRWNELRDKELVRPPNETACVVNASTSIGNGRSRYCRFALR